ncbi:hypothetical protein TNCV_1099411 [Trichonephila clavipes]|nr:hypothetical protein TNCV_1099411 [Trichonephila clavipes]
MNKIWKAPAGLDYPIVLSEEFVAVDDNVCTAPIVTYVLEFVQSSENNDEDSDDERENGVSDAAPVPASSEMMNVMKSMRSYLDAHSNREMSNKMNDQTIC